MKRNSVKNGIIVLLFCLFLAAPILTISWTGGEYSESENRNLAAAPDLFQDGAINFEGLKAVKPWLEDHIGLREEFIRLYADMQMLRFHQSSNVRIGKDGWLFTARDNNLQIASGEYPLTEENLAAILHHQLSVQEYLEKKGTDYAIVLPPSKISIYPEYARYGSKEIRETPVDMVANYLEQNSDLKVIRLKEALLEAKKTDLVYYKTDDHWNQFGAYTAYKAVVNQLMDNGLCTKAPVNSYFDEASYVGDLTRMLTGRIEKTERTKNVMLRQQNAEKDETSERYVKMREIADAHGNIIGNECCTYRNATLEGPSILIVGDSFFAPWLSMDMLLAENFPEFTFIRAKLAFTFDILSGDLEKLLDLIEPDLVLFEATERVLQYLPPTKNE